MNKTILRGKFRQTRGGLMAEWGRLTENDRLMFDGKIDQMLGVLQERYGYTRERAITALEHYMGRHKATESMLPTVSRTGRFALLSATGIALVGAFGWFIFSKLLVREKSPLLESENEKISDWMLDEFEAEDFDAEMMGFEAALD
jgi:uncharacterized protein YjbJ (UPF0337 family)